MQIKLIISYLFLLAYGGVLYSNSFVENLNNAYLGYSNVKNGGLFILAELFEYSFDDKKCASEFLQQLEKLPLYAGDNGEFKKLLMEYKNRACHANISHIGIDLLSSNYKATCLHMESISRNGKKVVSDNRLTFSAIGEVISRYEANSKKLQTSTVPKESIPYHEIPFIRMFLLNPYLIVNPPMQFTRSSIKMSDYKIITLDCLQLLCTERTFEMKGDFPILLKMRVFSNDKKENNRLLVHYRGYKRFENKLAPGLYYPSISIESPNTDGNMRQIKIAHIKAMSQKSIKKDDLEINILRETEKSSAARDK